MHTNHMVVSSESGRAPAHDLTLTDQLSVELAAVQRQINVEIHAIKGALRGVHALKVLFERLSRQVGSQRNYFFYAWI